MTNKHSAETKLEIAFKALLKEQIVRSQEELIYELSQRGFERITQSKASRMLARLGAVKTRNANNDIVYTLPEALIVPKVKQTIDTVVIGIKHNDNQIILKTSGGCAPLVARMLDTMDESIGILGTIAGDDTVLIIPANVTDINDVSATIRQFLQIK
ncbi:hypothetical protein [Thalassotalea sp. ND16A]|uniref:hypothetical protein n=1 Tax=Thalassotalea sp. ND16A TaxID=1535422 RepID=UPI00051A6F5D|nr:hypothetical protein [Thalassotalea sp. ND16A]